MPTGLKTYKENKLPHLIPSSYIDLPLGRDTSQTHYITFTLIFTLEKCISREKRPTKISHDWFRLFKIVSFESIECLLNLINSKNSLPK